MTDLNTINMAINEAKFSNLGFKLGAVLTTSLGKTYLGHNYIYSETGNVHAEMHALVPFLKDIGLLGAARWLHALIMRNEQSVLSNYTYNRWKKGQYKKEDSLGSSYKEEEGFKQPIREVYQGY